MLTIRTVHPWLHPSPPSSPLTLSALPKQAECFLTSLSTSPLSSTDRLVSKFVTSSPKHVVLSTLHHLLSPNPSHPPHLPLLLYTHITQASWFAWNSKLLANLIASLYSQGRTLDAEALVLLSLRTECSKERERVMLYSNLMEALANVETNNGLSETYARLREMVSGSSSIYVKKRGYEAMVRGACAMDEPGEAMKLVEEMRQQGIKPSAFEFRSVVEAYGRVGSFEEMLLTVAEMQDSGVELDTVTCNMVLSSYGQHKELSQMSVWLKRMKDSGVGCSVRTYNSVLNLCPTVMSVLQDLKTAPVTLRGLLEVMEGEEGKVVEELSGMDFPEGILTWDELETKLDLHGMHLGTSYVVVLKWMEELHGRFELGVGKIPAEVTVVCGAGKHSSVRGESPVKIVVREMMRRAGSPLRIDRKNVGCLIAKGKVVKEWLCQRQSSLLSERLCL